MADPVSVVCGGCSLPARCLRGLMACGEMACGDGVWGWGRYWREVVAVVGARIAGCRWSGWRRVCWRRADLKGAGAWLCLVSVADAGQNYRWGDIIKS